MLTSQQISTNIINQIWLLDPAMSVEVGTPERKIVDGVAEMVAGTQVDFSVLDQKHDLDAMTGGRLDAYLGNFGWGRQQPRAAAGGVTFSRTSPALQPITIPLGTQLIGVVDSSDFPNLIYVTTETVTIPFGSTSVTAPVRCTTVGSIGNLPSNSIQNFGGLKSIIGIPSDGITNSQPTEGGLDGESDAEFKIRFKNQIFRNMSGTYDYIIALAVAAATVSKANVVGPLSRYQEYIQVPAVPSSGVNEIQRASVPDAVTNWTLRVNDEAGAQIAVTAALGNDTTAQALKDALNLAIGAATGFVAGTVYVDVSMTGTSPRVYDITFLNRLGRRNLVAMSAPVQTGGAVTISTVSEGAAPTGIDAYQKSPVGGYDDNAGTVSDPFSWPFKLTTALSTIPYSKHAYSDNAFLTSGTLDPGTADFYRPFVDWVYNPNAVSGAVPPSFATSTNYAKGQTVLAGSEVFVVTQAGTSGGSAPTWPSTTGGAVTSGTGGVGNGVVVFRNVGDVGRQIDLSSGAGSAPNVTILGDQAASGGPVWPLGLEPGEIALFEHQYMSRNSRNDFSLGIMNSIDVYVNGGEPRTVSSVQVIPTVANALQSTGVGRWTYQKQTAPKVINFRRPLDGREARVGNRIQPLYWQPVLEVPDQISIGLDTYLRANHYNANVELGAVGYYNSVESDGAFLAVNKAHYIAVEEMNSSYGTVRARNGIEWFSAGDSNYALGLRSVGGVLGASGVYYIAYEGEQFDVANYVYDQNIAVSQALQDSKSQVTDDILVHRALRRYFKAYLTLMYSPGATQGIVNAGVNAALAVLFQNQFYGAAIQLSDILQAVHNVPGVDNVRWTRDTDAGIHRVEEVNALGQTLESGAVFWDNDFFIEDRELAAAPSEGQSVILKRAQNTWNS